MDMQMTEKKRGKGVVRHITGIAPFHPQGLGDTTSPRPLLHILRNTMSCNRSLTVLSTILPRTKSPRAISLTYSNGIYGIPSGYLSPGLLGTIGGGRLYLLSGGGGTTLPFMPLK